MIQPMLCADVWCEDFGVDGTQWLQYTRLGNLRSAASTIYINVMEFVVGKWSLLGRVVFALVMGPLFERKAR